MTRLIAALCVFGILLPAAPVRGAVPLRSTTAPSPPPAVPQPAATPAGPPSPRASAGETELLGARLNQIDQPEGVRALRLPNGRVAVPAETLADWRLKAPAGTAIAHEGRSYVPLDAVAGVRWRIEPATQTLWVEAPAEAFSRNRFEVANPVEATTITPSATGGYLNYDVNWQRDGGARGAPSIQRSSALIEAGAFRGNGNGRASGYWRGGGQAQGLAAGSGFVRLDTTWNVDLAEKLSSVRVGDAISGAGAWGRSVRYGGLQWASNYAMQPGFIRFPLPALRGEAALPSVVDLYVNNVHQLQGQLPPGPFDLPNVPVVTGPGQIRMVVRDLLGREQVIVQPYYVSPSLLRAGLHEYSVDVGFLRQDYGLASNHYGQAMVSATSRQGVTDRFTRELRAELQRRQQTVGAGGSWVVAGAGTLNGSAAFSRGPNGVGTSLGAAFDRQSVDWSGSLQVRWSSRDFVQLGQGSVLTPATRLLVTAGAGTSVGSGALSVNLLHQAGWQAGERLSTLSVSYGLGIGPLGFLGFYANRNLGLVDGYVVGVNLIHQLDMQTSVVGGLTSSSAKPGGAAGAGLPATRQTQSTLQAQRNPPPGEGVGYNLVAEGGTNARASAEASVQTERATLTAGVARANGAGSVRAGVSGGVAVMPEGVFASRRIDGSFAVVKVGDFENVRVTRDAQVVARTDRQGRALVTGLRSHEPNRIGVEAADLPMDAEVEQLQMAVAPGTRSGVSAVFAVRRTRAATLRLVLADGTEVPPGSHVQVEGTGKQYPVGYRGLVFVVGLAERTRIVADWPDHRCHAELVLTHAENDLPDLGTVVCRKDAS